MPLSAGARVGAYEVLGPLGAGGMGEVYRARDVRLKREAALKLLPERLARDAAALERFRREAQLLAALHHPHIAAVYGFDDNALAMELVEGETLAERLRRGRMPLEEALGFARQLAEALEYAHERGIIHRDLKPANIKLSGDDGVKVLDFGLAKALEGERAAASAAELADSPTLSAAATQAGLILGTAAYMAPEQARGKAADRRADIWAFGVVLFEVLTGRQAFAGETTSDILAAVLRAEPDLTALPAETPRELRRLVQRCLQKDPRQRLQAIGDARLALEEIAGGDAPPAAPDPPKRLRAGGWVVAGLALGAIAGGAAVWALLPRAAQRPKMTFRAVTAFAGVQTDPALSPDGHTIAFVSNRNGAYNVYVGLIGGGSLVQITHGPNLKAHPAWSPDGTELAYARLNRWSLWDVWEVPALGGTPRLLLRDAADPDWSPHGRRLVYARPSSGEIWIASSAGQSQRRLAGRLLARDLQPRFSPDGRAVAFVAAEGGTLCKA